MNNLYALSAQALSQVTKFFDPRLAQQVLIIAQFCWQRGASRLLLNARLSPLLNEGWRKIIGGRSH
jgi:hypothetical protein